MDALPLSRELGLNVAYDMDTLVTATVRQQIVDLLRIKPMDAQYLSGVIGVNQRAIEAHLIHVAKSGGKLFEITPATCRDCEYRFNGRTRTTKPTKCPKCKGEDITPPLFHVKGREK